VATKILLKANNSPVTGYLNADLFQSKVALHISVTNDVASGTKVQLQYWEIGEFAPVGGSTVAVGALIKWISEAFDLAATISGTVAFNLWANESSNYANCGIRVQLVKYPYRLALQIRSASACNKGILMTPYQGLLVKNCGTVE
jgi:hypothetical protein